MTGHLLRGALAGLVTALCWLLCLYAPDWPAWVRSGEHVACFLAWTLAASWWLVRLRCLGPARGLLAAGACGVAAAAIGECVQYWMPAHAPEWRGFGWSSLGVALGLASAALIRRCGRRPAQPDAHGLPEPG